MNPDIDEVLARLSQDASRDFVRHWFALRGGRAMPERRELDPAAIKHLLPKLWLWEFNAEQGDFVCRLAGEEIIEVFKRNPRGLLLGEWVPPLIADVARPRYRQVIDRPAVCVASGPSYVAGDKQAWCERVIVPLKNGADRPSVVFGLTVWQVPNYSMGPVEREETAAVFFPIADAAS